MIVRTEELTRYGPSGMKESKFEYVNGWFLTFFLYDKDENINYGVYRKKMKVSDINELANQMLEVPFSVNEVLNNNKTYEMVFNAGIIGIEQDLKTLLVKPKIGWCVYEKALSDFPEEEVVKVMKNLCDRYWSIKRNIPQEKLREVIKKHKGDIEKITKELNLNKSFY